MKISKEQKADKRTNFNVGQLVSVQGEGLGEVTAILENGFYRVWVEKDHAQAGKRTFHSKDLASFLKS